VAVTSAEAGDEGAFFASGVAPPGGRLRLYLNNTHVAGVEAGPDGRWALRVRRGMAPGHYDVRADLVDPASGKVSARAEVPFDYPQIKAAPRPSAVTAPRAPVTLGSGRPARTADHRADHPAASPPAPAQVQSPPAGEPGLHRTGPAARPAARLAGSAAGARPQEMPASADGIASAASQPGVAVVPEIQSVTVVRGDSLWRISRRILGRGIRYTQIYEANSSQIRDPNKIWPGQVLVTPNTSVE
jgi:nucleoid-associated protein YgaU